MSEFIFDIEREFTLYNTRSILLLNRYPNYFGSPSCRIVGITRKFRIKELILASVFCRTRSVNGPDNDFLHCVIPRNTAGVLCTGYKFKVECVTGFGLTPNVTDFGICPSLRAL